jgi:hypothetical protein
MSLSFDLINTTYVWGLLLLGAATLTLITGGAGKYFKVLVPFEFGWIIT